MIGSEEAAMACLRAYSSTESIFGVPVLTFYRLRHALTISCIYLLLSEAEFLLVRALLTSVHHRVLNKA
jgi:hypothetical protein